MTALTINRLAQRDIEAMIDGVVGNKPIPASVRRRALTVARQQQAKSWYACVAADKNETLGY